MPRASFTDNLPVRHGGDANGSSSQPGQAARSHLEFRSRARSIRPDAPVFLPAQRSAVQARLDLAHAIPACA